MIKMAKPDFAIGSIALKPSTRPKKNRVKDLKAKIKRVVNKAPEVMVKVTGGAKGAKHMKAHLDYIGRNGDIELENEKGEILDTKDKVREEHKEWTDDLGRARNNHTKPRANERDTIHLVLSMPEGTDSKAVQNAVRNFAKEEFSENYRYVMALHCPENDKGTKNPHVHLTVKALGHDGTKLNPKKADLQDWREGFAEKMREQGWDAEATARRSRGVITKSKNQIIKILEDDQVRPGRGKVQKAKILEAADALRGKPVSENPYREQIAETQKKIRKDWLESADELAKSNDPEDLKLAEQMRDFVKAMPKELQDERTKLKAELLAQIEVKRAQKVTEQTKPAIKEPSIEAPANQEKDKPEIKKTNDDREL